ncbi:hypothetical protein [Sulfolobus spindle-shaped virus]|nr:hypothetical protein [Sulfolobus spindle-shaped virus]AZG03158.1 hypothetical protein [Sulfolobus spindle-shaped virus]AZG03207.1 hypothetical protein [Sulfolobus spindle-shaped virus]AZG03334.1 hypothetical protein [Sulfolobus spindle-shaped virus]AZG03501.1 hypothetical protein [Sulfolobus spindle-shaped virus]
MYSGYINFSVQKHSNAETLYLKGTTHMYRYGNRKN